MKKSIHTSLILGIALFQLSLLGEARSNPPAGSLAYFAKIAKEKGQKNYTIPVPQMESGPELSLEKQLNDSLIIGGRIESSTVDASDGEHIYTWYKVKITARGSSPNWRVRAHNGDIPPLLPQVGQGETLVRVNYGTAVFDHIRITDNQEQPLIVGRQFLLFLEPLSRRRRPEDVFVYTFQTEPVELGRTGFIVHARKSSFMNKLAKLNSIQDVLAYGKP